MSLPKLPCDRRSRNRASPPLPPIILFRGIVGSYAHEDDLTRMPSQFFPPAGRATPEGLVAVGGAVTTARLLDAYRHGIFPWPTQSYEPMLWWSPDPRAILPLDAMHVPERLQRRIRRGEFDFRANTAFEQVIRECSRGHGREQGTWLTPEMIAAYTELHRLGHAHSVECWQDEKLVGGVYGVAIGGLFAAESMFYRVRDASKAAVARLVEHLRARSYQLLDVQQWTPHTAQMGVVEIPRREYLARIAALVELPVTFGDQLAG
jgi:leucyl/phenylalanyl-tRNA--protein transferase